MKEAVRLQLTDDELLTGLAGGSDAALTQLYRRYYPMVLHLILSNSGDEADAKDIFQEALIVLYEKVAEGSLDLHCQVKTYLYSVSRRLWLKQLAQRSRTGRNQLVESDDIADVADDMFDHDLREQQFVQMGESLNRLGEPCRTLLEDFYLRHLSMQDITEKFGYTNSDNAKTQKYKCLNRLKRLFFDH